MSTDFPPPLTHIGKYRLEAHIATGGMGMVYKAVDEKLGRVVALKVLDPELARKPNMVERFRREARAAARLLHRSVVTLYEYDLVDGFHFLAMEYVDGIDLADYIRRKGKVDPEEARRIMVRVCRALDYAYSQGIIHRDIKPSNILLARDGERWRVKLTDFGLARVYKEEEFRVTRAGHTVGTIDYMAPEQARDSALADIRSDIYSLGCTLYHMLAGQPPFAEGGLGERVYKHLMADPPDVRDFNPDVPPGLWVVLRKMLAKDPDDRYQSPAELLEALKHLPEDADEQTFESTEHEVIAPVPVPPSKEVPKASAPPKNRPSTVIDEPLIPQDAPGVLPLSAEHKQAATGQFTRAMEVRARGDFEYALKLLLSCCKLDPANLAYRQALREVGRKLAGRQRKSRWLGSFSNLRTWRRLKGAQRAGDHRKVLQYGEELLVRAPDDVAVQLALAESAEALGLPGLAVWLLEQARQHKPDDPAVQRPLARLYERLNRYKQAIALWELLRKANPSDAEASRKVYDLAATDTIARGNFRT